MPSLDSHAEALQEALAHLAFWHLDPLERAFRLPAYERAVR